MSEQMTLIVIIAIMLAFSVGMLAWELVNHSARIAELEQAINGESAIDNAGLDK